MSVAEDGMPITLNEKLIIGINAAVAAVGITVGIIAESLWFATTSAKVGGLGIGLSGAVATGAITGVGIVSALAAIPIAYIYYKDLIAEAEFSNEVIRRESKLRHKKQEKLFFEFMRLRSLFLHEHEFVDRVKSINYDEKNNEINKSLFISLVNKTYKKFENKKYLVDSKENYTVIIRKRDEPHAILFSDLLSNSQRATNRDIREKIMSEIKNQVGFDAILTQCFRHIPKPSPTNRHRAAGYGAIAGLTIAGAGLGTGWAFSSLVIGAGLCAAIPVIGWAMLGIGCITMGILFGVGVGLCKQKNIQREALKNKIQDRNHILNSANTVTHRAIYHRSEQIKSLVANPVYQLRSKHEVEKLRSVASCSPLKRFSLLSPRSTSEVKHTVEMIHNIRLSS